MNVSNMPARLTIWVSVVVVCVIFFVGLVVLAPLAPDPEPAVTVASDPVFVHRYPASFAGLGYGVFGQFPLFFFFPGL